MATVSDAEAHQEQDSVVWILVDHSARAQAFSSVASHLQESGIAAEVVTISEVIGSMARDALAGGAERVLRGLRVALQGRSDEDLIGAIRRIKPDVLVVTNPRHVRALSMLESLTGIPSLQLGVVPDYNLHAAWLSSGLHAFVVPHDEFSKTLTGASGLPQERVLIAGPAVQPGFARDLDKAALRREFGFSMSERTVIFRAESFDVTTIEKIVFQAKILAQNTSFTTRVIFHHGGDKSAASTLRRAAADYGFEALMFGKVLDFERYGAASDLMVCAPSDPLIPELIALGLPLLIVGEGGDYEAQTAFLTRHDIARQVVDLPRLSAQAQRMLGGDELTKHQEAAASIGLPGGSKEVSEAIIHALEHAQKWRDLAPVSDQSGQDTEGSTSPSSGSGSSFESIGGSGSGSNSSTASSGSASSSTSSSSASSSFNSTSGGSAGANRPSLAEAKEQLAQLILVERDLERRLGELEKEQERWRGRLNLARQWEEDELASEAEGILRGYMGEAEPLQQELQDVREQKLRLKQAAGTSTKSGGASGKHENAGRFGELEKRFRSMEESRDLDDLKDRIRRDFGED